MPSSCHGAGLRDLLGRVTHHSLRAAHPTRHEPRLPPLVRLRRAARRPRRLLGGARGALEDRGFTDVPRRLAHEVDHDGVLLRDDLLVSQTCGFVLANEGRDWTQYVATPRYGAPGCVGSDYASFIVVRDALEAESASDLAGLRAVANESLSHSGMNALREYVAPAARGSRFFSEVSWSGGHVCSLQSLQREDADCAAIDCVAWELVRRHRPQLLDACACSTRRPAPRRRPSSAACARPPTASTACATRCAPSRGRRAARRARRAAPARLRRAPGDRLRRDARRERARGGGGADGVQRRAQCVDGARRPRVGLDPRVAVARHRG